MYTNFIIYILLNHFIIWVIFIIYFILHFKYNVMLSVSRVFPGSSEDKESVFTRDSGLIPRLGRFPGEENDNLLW